MSIDYNMRNKTAGNGGRKSASFGAKFGVSKAKSTRVNSTSRKGQTVTSGGGHTPAPRNRGTSGLHLNRVNRPAGKPDRQPSVTKGGGHTSIKNVHGNPKVSPEC